VDNVTHTLFAATLARTPLARAGRGATAALVLASNAPDIDIVTAASGALNYLEWHRGPTHGPLGIVGLGLGSAALVWVGARLLDRWRGTSDPLQIGRLAGISIVGVFFHVLMDLPTSYGSRLLSPFDWHWYAIDLMPIIDIYLLTILAAGLWARRPLRGASLAGTRGASLAGPRGASLAGTRGASLSGSPIMAFTLMALYYGLRMAAHREALAAAPVVFGPALPPRCEWSVPQGPLVDRWPIHGAAARDGGPCLVEVVALPSFTSPFRWRLLAQLSGRYESREIDLFGRERGEDAIAVPNHWTAPVLQAARSRTAQEFLGFSRFPAAQAHTGSDGSATVTWTDLRFNDRPPRTVADRRRGGFFTATVRISTDGEILEERLGP
jgi:membrane-bound metal-dependent hydrolase YbcI (DUF457 family)